jgi:hypothetical protein
MISRAKCAVDRPKWRESFALRRFLDRAEDSPFNFGRIWYAHDEHIALGDAAAFRFGMELE